MLNNDQSPYISEDEQSFLSVFRGLNDKQKAQLKEEINRLIKEQQSQPNSDTPSTKQK